MNNEAKLITAICENKDIASALHSPDIDDLFSSHKDIWEKMRTHYYKYRTAPSLSLVKEWFTDFEPAEISGPTAYYVESLRNDKIVNGLNSISEGIDKAIDKEVAPEKILAHLQKRLSELNRFSAGIKDLNIMDQKMSAQHYEQVKEKVKAMGGAVGIRTGFDSIDTAYTTGQAPGHFIGVIGWPGHKKTFLAGKLAINVWKQGFRPMIVSLEMSPDNMRDRIYTMMGEGLWRMSGFNRGDVDIEKFKEWTNEYFEDRQDFIIVSPEGLSEITPATIQAKIDQYKPDWIMVDYLQLLTDNKKSGADSARVMNISKELKALAMSNSIPVIAVIAATSTDKEDRKRPPALSQSAWSKSIEYDADLAFSVHTYESDIGEKITEVTKRKNRHGDDFNFYVELDPETGEFTESWEAPDWLDNA